MKTEASKSQKQSQSRNPLQPVELVDGVMRFKRNKIVDRLVDIAQRHGYSLNEIVTDYYEGVYSQDDMEQLAQLIGYSICGFHEISYVSDETAQLASIVAKTISPDSGGCRDGGCEIHIGVERE